MQTDGSLADIEWGSGVDAEALLAELSELELDGSAPLKGAHTAREVAEVLEAETETGAGDALARTVSRSASCHLTQGTPFSGKDVGAAAVGLDGGYYLVASTHADANGAHTLVFPTLITVGKGNVELTPKESAPSLEKLVLEDSTGTWDTVADAETGQDVSFRIEVSLSELLGCDHLGCRIIDELPSGMELDADTVSISCDNVDIRNLFMVDLSENRLVAEADEIAGADLPEGHPLIISYTARLTAASPLGEDGSINAAYLEVEADGQRCVTPASKTALLTYRLCVTKVDAANHAQKLAGASFVLSREDGCFAVVQDGAISSWTRDESAASLLTTDASGRVSVAGLDSDRYLLMESTSPSGYQKRSESIPLSIESDLSFDIAAASGHLASLRLASNNGSSPGDTSTGTLFCTIENAALPSRTVPSTGDETQAPLAFALLGAGCLGGAACTRRRRTRSRDKRGSEVARIVAGLALALICLVAHNGCVPIRALAQESATIPETSVEEPIDKPDSDIAPEAIDKDVMATEGEPASASEPTPEPVGTLGLVIGAEEAEGADEPIEQRRASPALLGSSPTSYIGVNSESDIPRSSTNSYINILNMSFENAFIMVNDATNFACSDTRTLNSYINWSFSKSAYGGLTGLAITGMVLYRGDAGAHGANNDLWGIDTISDTSENGLVAIWFRNAGVLSDTGEPVSMLLKLKEYQLKPNYQDYYNSMSGLSVKENVTSYRQFKNDGGAGLPLLYIFPSLGVDQTDPSNARVWMNAVWQSRQVWEVSFYRSKQWPTRVGNGLGYSFASLDLSSDQLVSKASNGETYLARQYCYDLDIPGIRWLDPFDGSYSSSSPYNTPGNTYHSVGGAYITSAGAESFAWVTGNVGTPYASNSTNLKNDTYGGLTYWLHDYNRTAGGTWNGYRWQSNDGTNTDWRNAVASDILPQSTFAWVGTSCGTGINLNSQFRGTGTLRVSKAVSDGSDASFPFKITLESPSYGASSFSWSSLSTSFSYSITDAQGTVVSGGNLRSGNTVELADGQSLTVTGIPEGTHYTVAETAHAGYQPALLGLEEPTVADSFEGIITNGVTSEVAVTNVRLLAPVSWSIIKEGDSGELLEDAEFTVRFFEDGNSTDTPDRAWILSSDGDGVAKLDAAHLVSGSEFYRDATGAIGLPAGTLTIEETRAPSNYERDVTVRTFEVAEVNGVLTCMIDDTLLVGNTRLTGNLTVAKEVAGTGADTNRSFAFSVMLSLGGAPLSGTFGGISFNEGQGSFTLKDGQTKTLTDIPAGADYEVSEGQAPGYSASWTNDTGTIAAHETASAHVTNTYTATGRAQLELTKAYETDEGALEEGQFRFELHEGAPDGRLVDTVACKADGSITFELELSQEAIGNSFTYYVTEVNDGQQDVVYDTHAAKVDVLVTNLGNGRLGAEVSYSEPTFYNSHQRYLLPETGFGGIVGSLVLGMALCSGAGVTLAWLWKKQRTFG